jgi:hypothetical protein
MTPSEAKKKYVKPSVTRVPLRPEEAVLGNCKTSGTSGPVQPDCDSPTTCSSQGS